MSLVPSNAAPEPWVVIERPSAAARTVPVPVLGRAGSLGPATWDEARGCHCLRLPLSVYRPERHAIADKLRRWDRIAFDLEMPSGSVAAEAFQPTAKRGDEATELAEIETLVASFRHAGEPAASTLRRIIAHLRVLQAWLPTKGRKPELLSNPAPAASAAPHARSGHAGEPGQSCKPGRHHASTAAARAA